jgi:hypothetical protein
MASDQQLKQYLAYWAQLGKPIVDHAGQEKLLPSSVIRAIATAKNLRTAGSK